MEFNFNEKNEELYEGKKLKVFKTPKYNEAKSKAVSMLKDKKYKDSLTEGDFWILMRANNVRTCMVYSGLIISHNGCLKINDIEENKVNPNCFHIDKEGYNNSLVFTYIDDDTYEVGEVNARNCKNEYPYAMAFKRCFDRVVLKKSKLAYAGIYSEVEAEEFKNNELDEQVERNKLILEIEKLCSDLGIEEEKVSSRYASGSTDIHEIKDIEDLRKAKAILEAQKEGKI